MKFRKATKNARGTIDCEIEHPEHGWIPFTCDPDDIGAAISVAALYVELEKTKPAKYKAVEPDHAEIEARIGAIILSKVDLAEGLAELLEIPFDREKAMKKLKDSTQ
jgi:hypothetical protein